MSTQSQSQSDSESESESETPQPVSQSAKAPAVENLLTSTEPGCGGCKVEMPSVPYSVVEWLSASHAIVFCAARRFVCS